MPNWCENKLIVSGNEHALQSFASSAQKGDSPFSFDALVPMPAILREIHTGGIEIEGVRHSMWRETKNPDGSTKAIPVTPEERDRMTQECGATDWYDWACRFWGTKWDASDPSVDFDEDSEEVTITFQTAWGPPRPFVEAVSAKFPMLRFTLMYAEPGMGFGGVATFEGGEQTHGVETGTTEDTAMLSEWHRLMSGFDPDEEDTDNDINDDAEEAE